MWEAATTKIKVDKTWEQLKENEVDKIRFSDVSYVSCFITGALVAFFI